MCLCELAILASLLFLRAASVGCRRAAVELTTTGCVLCRAVRFYHLNKWTEGSFYGMPLILTCTRASKQMVTVVINLFYPNSVVATFYENVEIAGKVGRVNTKWFSIHGIFLFPPQLVLLQAKNRQSTLSTHVLSCLRSQPLFSFLWWRHVTSNIPSFAMRSEKAVFSWSENLAEEFVL